MSISSDISREFWASDLRHESARLIARVQLSEAEEAVLIPALCSQIPYHLLLFPESEVPSWMHLSADEICSALTIARRINGELEAASGDKLVLSEHGSARCGSPHGQCVWHAHLHLFPLYSHADALLKAHFELGGAPMLVEDLGQRWGDSEHSMVKRVAEVKRQLMGEDYILFSPDLNVLYAWINRGQFPSQFIAQAAARVLGADPRLSDWRLNLFHPRLQFTAETLRARIQELLSSDLVATGSALSQPDPLLLRDSQFGALPALAAANPYISMQLVNDLKALSDLALSPVEHIAEAALDQIRFIMGKRSPGIEQHHALCAIAERQQHAPSILVRQAAEALGCALKRL